MGVWCITSLGAVPQLTTVMCCHALLRVGGMIIYFAISLVALWIILTYDSAKHRVIALTVQYLFRVGLHIFRLCPLSGGHPYAFTLMTVVDLLAAPGALINGLKVPERWLPGKVDYIGNGHTLMHVISFFVVLVSKRAFLLDLEWYMDNPCANHLRGRS